MTQYPKEFTDQLGNRVMLSSEPRRIISLVPSQTELLYDLGLQGSIAGITKFCIHPETLFRTCPRVGGTKTVDLQKVHALQPDLIIANKEENVKEQVEALASRYPVWISDIQNLGDALNMIEKVGKLVNRSEQAARLRQEISREFTLLNILPGKGLRVTYFIWRGPWMSAGRDTFIHHILERCGLTNAFGELTRYPIISADMLREAEPDIIFLSSEPYPFRETHFSEFTELCPNARIMLVDGEMFSWYGSRLLHAPHYLHDLLKTIEGRS